MRSEGISENFFRIHSKFHTIINFRMFSLTKQYNYKETSKKSWKNWSGIWCRSFRTLPIKSTVTKCKPMLRDMPVTTRLRIQATAACCLNYGAYLRLI